MLTMRQCADAEEGYEAFKFAMPGDTWPGDDAVVWVAERAGRQYGMMAAVHWEDVNAIYLAGAAVPERYQGRGVYQRMLRHLERWSRKQGADAIVTYTFLHNYESMGGLLKAGFRFARPPVENQFVGPNVHYFAKKLTRRKRPG